MIDPSSRRRGLYRVTPERLAEVLHLPEGTDILGVHWEGQARMLVFDIEHESFAPIGDGVPALEFRCRSIWDMA